MGWFKEKYPDADHPKMPIKDFTNILDRFGEEAAIQTLCDVQDDKVSLEVLEKYLYRSEES